MQCNYICREMVRWYLYLYTNGMSWIGKMTILQWAMKIRSAGGRESKLVSGRPVRIILVE